MGCIGFGSYSVFSVQHADDVTLIEPLNVDNSDVNSFSFGESRFSGVGLKVNAKKCK